MRKPSPRRLAELAGEKLYFPAKPCEKGHIGPNDTQSGKCLACKRARDRKYYARNLGRAA